MNVMISELKQKQAANQPKSSRNPTINEMWGSYGGPSVCSRTTFSAVVSGTYQSLHSNLAQDIQSFVDGYRNPEKFGF